MLDRGQVIQLPEDRPVAALERVLAMQDAKDILGRDVVLVDIRRPARPTMRLGEGALGYLEMTRAFERGLSTQ